MVVDDARAGARALRYQRHRRFVEAALHHKVEHRVQDRFALAGLFQGRHLCILPCRAKGLLFAERFAGSEQVWQLPYTV